RPTHRNAVVVVSCIETAQDFDESQRIYLPYAGRVRIVAVERRSAGTTQHVADAKCIRAQQVRLQHHQTLFPGGGGQNDLHTWYALLDQQRDAGRTSLDARAADRTDNDRLAAGELERLRVADGSLRVGANRRRELTRDDKLTSGRRLQER